MNPFDEFAAARAGAREGEWALVRVRRTLRQNGDVAAIERVAIK